MSLKRIHNQMKDVIHDPTLFFHRPDFVFRNKEERIISFQNNAGVSIHFIVQDDALISLPRSPFGGFVFSAGKPLEIDELFNQVDAYAIENRIKSIYIIYWPQIYSPDHSEELVCKTAKAGYSVLYKDIAQVFNVTGEPPAFNRLRRRCLSQSIVAGFKFQELPLRELPQAHDLFVECRAFKEYPMTMSLKDLDDTFNKFPDEYKLFGVYDGDVLIAASVVIWVTPSILYCFYVGDKLSYRKFSPVTFLVKQLLAYAHDHNAKILDMGISTSQGVYNKGLYDFKKSMGTFDSLKYTFVKKFE